jgi:hypothetical protein
MTTLPFPSLSPEGIQVIKDALAGTHHEPEHELSGALRLHEGVQRWWQGVRTALSRGVEGSQARALLSSQISFCEVAAIFLQLALDNPPHPPGSQDMDRARAALAETREIEAKAQAWLAFLAQPTVPPSEEQLARGRTAYERGETVDIRDAAARLRTRRP